MNLVFDSEWACRKNEMIKLYVMLLIANWLTKDAANNDAIMIITLLKL